MAHTATFGMLPIVRSGTCLDAFEPLRKIPLFVRNGGVFERDGRVDSFLKLLYNLFISKMSRDCRRKHGNEEQVFVSESEIGWKISKARRCHHNHIVWPYTSRLIQGSSTTFNLPLQAKKERKH